MSFSAWLDDAVQQQAEDAGRCAVIEAERQLRLAASFDTRLTDAQIQQIHEAAGQKRVEEIRMAFRRLLEQPTTGGLDGS